MNRRFANYLIFGAVGAGVVLMAVNHNRQIRYLVDSIASRSPNAAESAAELIKEEQFGDSISGEPMETRVAAVDALVALGTADAAGQFGVMLKDPDKPVRDHAVEGAVKIGGRSDEHIQKLVLNIKEGDPNQRGNAVKALQELGQQDRSVALRIIPQICAIMKKEGGARTSGGDVMGGFKNAQAESIRELVPYLSDKDEAVRVAAVEALGKVGSPAAVPILAGQMKTSAQVRRVSIGAIALIADKSGEPYLTEALRNPNEDNEARAQAATGLGRIGSEYAIRTLVAALQDYDLKVQLASVAALSRVGRRAISPLVACIYHSTDNRVRMRAVDSLGRMQLAEANQGLIMFGLRARDPAVRRTSAVGLGWPGNSDAVDSLIEELSDKDGEVAQAASESLARIGAPARRQLIAALNGSESVAYLAAKALAGQGKDAVADVEAAVTASDRARRWKEVALQSVGAAN